MEDTVQSNAEWLKTSKRRWMRVLICAWTIRNIQILLESPYPSPPHVELHRWNAWPGKGGFRNKELFRSTGGRWTRQCCPELSSSLSQIFTSPWQLLPGQDLEGCWHLVGLPCNIMKSHSWFLIPRFAMAGSVWSLLSWEREGGEAVSRKGRSQQLAAQHILGGRKNVLPQSVVEQQDSSQGGLWDLSLWKGEGKFWWAVPFSLIGFWC